MEDAPPIALMNQNNNNNNNNEIKFDKSETFEINKIFSLKISYNDKIFLFEIEEKNQFPKKDCKIFLNLEELGKINRYFLQFASSQEVFESLKNLIQKQNLIIIKEEKLMKIWIKNPSNEKEFFIDVPFKENFLKNELDSIIPYISSLNNRITVLENRLTNLEEQFRQFFQSKPEPTAKIETPISKKENDRSKALIGDFCKSNIIDVLGAKYIISWLEEKPKSIKLLLDSKIDGDKITTFYEKCKDKAPTVVIIESTDGYKFGGYISIPWYTKRYGVFGDSKSFIFSLTKMEKYPIVKQKNAIQVEFYYFAFGAIWPEIYIENNCHSNSKNSCSKYGNYAIKEKINGGKTNFKVLSYEVYEINY